MKHIILISTLNSFAQDNLRISKETKEAIGKKTRQIDGIPGENYWQNTSDYLINVSINIKSGTLSGEEKIIYKNNSPDSLNTIVLRLYQDLFKKGNNRNSIVEVDSRDIHDGVNINSVKINYKEINLDKENSLVKRHGTLMSIKLQEQLAPNKEIELEIKWDFKIPRYTLIRMGTIDSTSLFLGQWYPQVAVYDDIVGWDNNSYNGLAEFYNDFANFDVNITVPADFMVWATGEPRNLAEVIQPKYFDRYKKASVSEKITNVITEEDLKNGNITTQNNTWNFVATQVTDFAFGISDHYLWDVTSVEVDKKTKRRTVVGGCIQ